MPRFPTWLERLQHPDLHSDDLVDTPPPPADSGPAMEDEPDEWYGTAEDNEQAAMDAKKTTRELGEDRRMGITNTFGRELDALKGTK